MADLMWYKQNIVVLQDNIGLAPGVGKEKWSGQTLALLGRRNELLAP